MAQPPRYNVLGVGVSAIDMDRAREAILTACERPHSGYVCCATAHGLTEACADPELRRIYNSSCLTTPDGMPLVWLGPPGTQRVYGPDLMLAVCDAGRAVGLRHFLLGGAPGVAEVLRGKLVARFPRIEIVGTLAPPFRKMNPEEFNALKTDISRTRPHIVWVGLGSPKQERFMAAHANDLDCSLLIGVGAAFDFHTGRVRQAPRWIQRSGFEWLFRLLTEPRRLGPRYLKTNPLFAARVLAQKLRLKNYPID